jgi:hypothetical protein
MMASEPRLLRCHESFRHPFAVAPGLLGSVGGAWAQPHWRDLPPEERRQMRQQMREHWQHERDAP